MLTDVGERGSCTPQRGRILAGQPGIDHPSAVGAATPESTLASMFGRRWSRASRKAERLSATMQVSVCMAARASRRTRRMFPIEASQLAHPVGLRDPLRGMHSRARLRARFRTVARGAIVHMPGHLHTSWTECRTRASSRLRVEPVAGPRSGLRRGCIILGGRTRLDRWVGECRANSPAVHFAGRHPVGRVRRVDLERTVAGSSGFSRRRRAVPDGHRSLAG